MPAILQKLRSGIAKADEYIQEHDLAAKLDPIATVGGFLVVLSLVVLGISVVVVVPHTVIQRSLDAALAADRAKQLELEDTYRKTITQIVLGVFGLFLLYFTWRRSVAGDKTVRIAEQGHITDRFTKAVEQLGKTDGTAPNIEVRLGAIYALERIAFDSPRDHWTIMEILTAYIRQNAPLDAARSLHRRREASHRHPSYSHRPWPPQDRPQARAPQTSARSDKEPPLRSRRQRSQPARSSPQRSQPARCILRRD